jgi:hypothetical protein
MLESTLFRDKPTMSRLHVIAQFTFRIVPTVALTTDNSSCLWLCHEGLPPGSSLAPFNSATLFEDTPSGEQWESIFQAVGNLMAKKTQGEAKVSSATSIELIRNGRRIFNLGPHCGVEMWRGGLGAAYLFPALSLAGASLASPCFRFHTPLIEPDVRVSRFRLSEKTHAIAVAIACDAVCNF